MHNRISTIRAVALAAALAVGGYAPAAAATEAESQPSQAEIAQTIRDAQPRLLRRQVEALSPDRPQVTDLYFLGVGGYAAQDVFMHETRYAAKLFDRRFGTVGRSMTLINNAKTLREAPLASLENLRGALAGIAQAMDREHDVLFLFMTSHGNVGEFSTFFGPLTDKSLSAEALAAALDESGIKWRVIVISACYSGSFVEPLRNDHTVVMTASAADRNSFGCSNEATFTYFGQAYLEDALNRHDSFIDAFVEARKSVNRREKDEGLKPSKPQLAVGSQIRRKLREIEAGVARLAVSRP